MTLTNEKTSLQILLCRKSLQGPYHCSELHSLLSNCRINFDVIGITESRLKHNQKALQNINIPNYNIERCLTEGPNGGALGHIQKKKVAIRDIVKIEKSQIFVLFENEAL